MRPWPRGRAPLVPGVAGRHSPRRRALCLPRRGWRSCLPRRAPPLPSPVLCLPLLKYSRRSRISAAAIVDASVKSLRRKCPMGRWLDTMMPAWWRARASRWWCSPRRLASGVETASTGASAFRRTSSSSRRGGEARRAAARDPPWRRGARTRRAGLGRGRRGEQDRLRRPRRGRRLRVRTVFPWRLAGHDLRLRMEARRPGAFSLRGGSRQDNPGLDQRNAGGRGRTMPSMKTMASPPPTQTSKETFGVRAHRRRASMA
jgi:hypothetical protein